jgi:RNA polymerase sigma-70 factor (ECF subfamily)
MSEDWERDGRFVALMRSAQDGDGEAYAQLLTEVAPLLRRHIRRQWPFLSSADAEDLVQDILLSLHLVRATYDPRRPFLPWLTAIARHRMIDGVRRYARRAAHEIAVEQLPETFSLSGTNIRDEVYGDPEELRQAIRCLPAGQRQAVELLKLRELSLKEASAASGMSIGALKVAVHRALKALRLMLRREA